MTDPLLINPLGPVPSQNNVPDESTVVGLAQDPMLVNEMSGESTATQDLRIEEEAKDARARGEWNLLDSSLDTSNTWVRVARDLAIDYGNPAEEGFDIQAVPGIFDGVPPMYHKALSKADSLGEAYDIRGQILNEVDNAQRLAASGYTGMAAQIAAGLIDADALLAFTTGGTYLGTKTLGMLGKAGVKSGRIAGSIAGTVAGAEAGLLVSGADALLTNTGDAGDIPATILGTMALGGTAGAVFGKNTLRDYAIADSARFAYNEYVDARANQFSPLFKGQRTLSAAAAYAPDADPFRVKLSEGSTRWYDNANADVNARHAQKVLKGEEHAETTNADSIIGRGAEKVQNWVDKSPLKGIYTSVADMGDIGNKLAYDLFYHPGGLIDGNYPAAGYDALYTQELSTPIQQYYSHAMRYMNRPTDRIRDNIANVFVTMEEHSQFSRAVRFELESRYHDGAGQANAHPAVKEFADLMDEMHVKAVQIQQGRAGETPVFGSENLQPKSGYYRRMWSGEAIAKFDEKAVHAALTDAYIKLLPPGTVDPKIVAKITKSIITRAKALDEGIDVNVLGLLRDGGKEFIRDTLKNNTISNDEIDSIINALTGNAAERGKAGHLKNRIELDMRTPIPGTNATLLDLLDPDLYRSIHRYTRSVAGSSALARKGYQVSDKSDIISAMKDEMVAKGLSVKDPRIDDILDTAFSYFGVGPVGGGVGPLALSAMRLTRQSLLGSLGLTQMSELGNVIAMTGVEAAMKQFPDELRALTSGKKTPIIQELHDAFIFLDKDHLLYDDKLALDIASKDTVTQSRLIDGAYKTIAQGDKILGYTSLFYQATTFTQRLALSGVNHKLYKLLKDGPLVPDAARRRLLDMGFDESMTDMIAGYIQKGTVKEVDGQLTLGLEKWDAKDLNAYKLALHQFTNRAVQKGLPGENPYWATKGLGQVLTQLRMFPILAFQKQFLRQMRHADATTVAAMLYNLGVAAIVYSMMETIKGRGDNLSPDKIAKGAINYSPTTGWLPMATDPLAEIMGMPELRMNKYGPPGRATDGIIPTPPVIPTMNRMLHLPGVVFGGWTDGVDRNEASALAATPIIGNMYGFSALFNHMKENE